MTPGLTTESSHRSTTTDNHQDVDELMRHSDEQLEELVLSNLGPDSSELWETLSTPPFISRVRNILIATQRRVEKDIRVRRSRRDERRTRFGFDRTSPYEQNYDDWRARVVVFRRLAEDRIAQTRAAAADDNLNRAELNSWHRNTARRLAEAIDCHRRALAEEFDPEPADQALWEILDEVTVPIGPNQRPVFARDMLDTHWASETDEQNSAPTQPDGPA